MFLCTEGLETSGEKPVAYKTFCKFWNQLVPYIIVGKPMSDLCWTCQQNSTMITRTIIRSEDEKSEVKLQCAHNHNTVWCKNLKGADE